MHFCSPSVCEFKFWNLRIAQIAGGLTVGCGSVYLLFPESGAILPARGPHTPETGSHC